ncbi:MAG: murein biosynthesis integral membrane protein MurJ [Burkholderiales bacterium]|jgi:putative peptidoglycan lipid II flippase|nr:murein biosynthesis integral membrane protein MurJ [Burkholderiales bacterium]
MNLLKAASTVSLLTLASRVSGLVRDQLIAASFGASGFTDAYNVAFRIPNLLRRLFAEGAFSQAFVPLLANTRIADGDAATHKLVDAVATVLGWVLLATCVIGVLAAPALVWALASGLERFDAAVVMTRIMFPYIGFMSMVALSAGILNTWGRFSIPAATPILLNIAIIVAARGLTSTFEAHGLPGVYALAVGVMLGGVLQAAVQIPALKALGLMPHIRTTWRGLVEARHHPGVGRVLRQMSPALLGVSVAQVSLLINTQIASHLATKSVSWLTFADRLMEFPTSLLGVALGVVLIPQLSAARARGDHEGYSSMIDWGLRLVVLQTLPCAAALLVFARPLLAVLYHYGHFQAADVLGTVPALEGYGLGLLGIVSVKILAPGFFAQLDTRTPVRIAIAVLVFTQLMNLLFVFGLHIGVGGLALSIGLGATLNACWLLVGLIRLGVYKPLPGWFGFLVRALVATAMLGACLVWADHAIDWLDRSHPVLRAAKMAGVLGGVALLYVAVLSAMGIKLKQFMRKA